MAEKVASIFAEIGLDSSGLASGAISAGSVIDSLLGSIGKIDPALALAVGAAVGLVKVLGDIEKAGDEAARGDARLEAVLKSTGEAAGYNFEKMDALATSYSKMTGIDDDLIKKAEAVQLTFTNISGNAFPAAMQAALDLSAVLGGDLQGATIQVDKAMNDFSGYTALKRAGVSFSEEQIKQIANFKETNNLAGYQELILGELTKEFGGAAQAMHDAGDHAEDVANAWDNLTQNAGGGLVPAMRSINDYLVSSIDGWNGFLQGLQGVNTTLSDSTDWLTRWVQTATIIPRALADWTGITQHQTMTEKEFNAAVAQNVDKMMAAAGATDKAAQANQAYVPTAEEVADALKEITKTHMAIIGTINSMQSAEENYTKRMGDLTKQRSDLDQKLHEAIGRGYEKTKGEIQGYQDKIAEVRTQEYELSEERKKQALQFVSDILLQKLEQQGMTDAAFEAFAKQQEAWGLWSADTVAKAQAAWQEADKVSASINNIPKETPIAIDVTTTYTEQGNPPQLPGSNYQQPRAAGGAVTGMGSWTLVGEQGPELVKLPTGSYVHNANDTAGMMSGGGVSVNLTVVYNASLDGADERAVASRLKQPVIQIMRDAGVMR